jgi:thiol-disulfide isomerase/thioredoxin
MTLTGASLAASVWAQSPPSSTSPVANGPAWLGVMLAQDTGPNGGVMVRRVMPGSPAMQGGVTAEMEILSLNGVNPTSSEHFVQMVSATGAGSNATILIYGRPEPLEIRLAARPPRGFSFADAMVGQPLPNLEVDDVNSEQNIDLRPDVMPPATVVEFWATWCGPCAMALPGMRDLRNRFSNEQLRMVSVSDEDPATLLAHLITAPMTWYVASDPTSDVIGELWVDSYPTWLVIDSEGTIVAVERGAEGVQRVQQTVERLITPP